MDAARGVGMVAIVTGHSYLPWDGHPGIFTFLYSFHVPAFFFLSGLVFRSSGRSLRGLVAARARGVLLPYLTWALVSVLTYDVLGQVAAAALGRQGPSGLGHDLVGVVLAVPTGHWMDWNKPLWFLPAVMVAYVIGALVERVGVTRLGLPPPVWLVVSLPLSWWAVTHPTVTLPWSVERVVMLMPFFLAGVVLRGPLVGARVAHPLLEGAAGLSCWAATAVVASSFPSIDYVSKEYPPFLVLMLGATLGTAGLVLVARALPWRALTRVGTDSLAVLVMHKFVVVALQLAIGRVGTEAWGLPASLWSVAMAVVAVLVCVLVAVPVSALAPWAFGRLRPQAQRARS